MKTQEQLKELAGEILAAWNDQDPDAVAAMYTDDVTYRDRTPGARSRAPRRCAAI